MKYRVFQFAIPCDEEVEELNQFLATHRVTAVAHHLIRSTEAPALVFVVEYVSEIAPKSGKTKVDYREVLSDGQFVIFSRLRDLRKKIAEQEGVPVYTVFTNAQLAEIVQRNVQTVEALAGIAGLGKARIEKYGSQVISVLSDVTTSPAVADEKS